ncbi:hypothetical protein AVEN_244054-1 [Araneus ventricosus]|uniref:Secreted protein n=1 Tax=Araneus ventricosus TaxID=182803 RepID=A0A4Y2IHH1_ARAVE|nr:hypothetical protein AVEN_244054-1 [Araneus ventricosus]
MSHSIQRLCRCLLVLGRLHVFRTFRVQATSSCNVTPHLAMIGGSPRGWGGYSTYKTSCYCSGKEYLVAIRGTDANPHPIPLP